jgi:hypothetical protein
VEHGVSGKKETIYSSIMLSLKLILGREDLRKFLLY